MSVQLLQTLTLLDSPTIDDAGESFVDGISSVLGQIECSDTERVVLVSLAVAFAKANTQYSAELVRDVKGRELAAEGVVQVLLKIVMDEECDWPSRLLANALARELGAVIKIVDVLERDPTHSARLLLDSPL